MSQILILLRQCLLSFRRTRAGVVITFLVPIVLIYLFGHVFGLYRREVGPSGIPLAVVNESPEPAAKQLVEALRAEPAFRLITTAKNPNGTPRPLTEANVRTGLRENEYRFALILPADLLADDRLGLRLRFLSNPRNEIETQTVNGLLQKTIFAQVPQLLGLALQKHARRLHGDARFDQFNRGLAGAVSGAFGGDADEIRRRIEAGDFLPDATPAPTAPADPALRRLDAPAAASGTATANSPAPARSNASANLLAQIVRFEIEQVAGKQVKNPMAARLVGGYAIMFLLFAVSGSAAAFFEAKNSGVFQRLLASPVRPAHIIWARFLFGVVLGLLQISALMLAGRFFFDLEIFSHGGALLAVALSSAAACSAFGMLIAAVSPNATAANGLATLLVLTMSAIGGAWFPVVFMPDYIQAVSKFTLVYWSVEGFTDVLWAGQPLLEVLPKVGILAGMAAGVLAVAVACFNRSKLFD
jgi:ABC-2 type transport system permease protein